MKLFLLPAALSLLLAACDIPGMGPDPRIALREADGKAMGAACRHALRGIEECYGLNEKAPKTAIFEGWKEMDQYMRENKIEGIPPRVARGEQPDEVVIEDSKPAAGRKEKTLADSRARALVASTTQKLPEKTTAAADATK